MELDNAKKQLDDFTVTTQKEFQMMQGIPKNKQREMACYNLARTLRDHEKEPINDPDEVFIRIEMDKFLDFLTKISYFLSNEIITKEELKYFKYYIEKINYSDTKKERSSYEKARLEAIKKYIGIYFYPEDFEKPVFRYSLII